MCVFILVVFHPKLGQFTIENIILFLLRVMLRFRLNVTSQRCGGLEIGNVVFLSPQSKAARLNPSSVMELTRQHNDATFAFPPICISGFFF